MLSITDAIALKHVITGEFSCLPIGFVTEHFESGVLVLSS
jgi:hypothetical protein